MSNARVRIWAVALLAVGCAISCQTSSASSTSSTSSTSTSASVSVAVAPTSRPPAPRTIAFLGDSMVAIGQDRYRAAVEGAGYSVLAYAAQNGATLRAAYSIAPGWTQMSVQDVLALQPSVLYVSFGINDSTDPIEVTPAGFERLLDDARAHHVQCVVWQTWLADPNPNAPDRAVRLGETWTWLRAQDALRADLVLNDLQPILEREALSWVRPNDIHFNDVGVYQNAIRIGEAVDRCTLN
jgi:hypothetical protein